MRKIIAITTTAVLAGCVSGGHSYKQGNPETDACNTAITFMLKTPSLQPDLGAYRSNAVTAHQCLRDMEVASGMSKKANKAKRRAKQVLRTNTDDALYALVTGTEFLSVEDKLRQIERRLEFLGGTDQNIKEQIFKILRGEQYKHIPTDRGDAWIPGGEL